MTVGLVMLFVLLPIRIMLYQYVSQSWLGSFGAISAITVLLLYLSEKNKLGKFSGMFKRQMYKFHKGKRKYYVYTMTGIQFFLLVNIIYAIEIQNNYTETKTELEALVPNYANIDDVIKDTKKTEPKDFVMAFVAWGYLYLYHYDVYVSLISIMNDLSNGYMMHFSIVFLVECIEFSAIMVYTRWKSKNYEKSI